MTAMFLLLSLQQVDFEIEARAASVQPKFRFRDGEKSLKGDSLFSRELDAEDDVFSPGFELRAIVGAERFTYEFWNLTAEGEGVTDESKAWGGRTLPAGTQSDTEVLFQRQAIGWSHRFAPTDWLRIEPGATVEYLVVSADLGFGKTRLGGVFPTPQVTVTASPWLWLEVSATAGGFFLPFRSGDTSILDPIEYALSLRGRWDRFSVAIGYDLNHLHLEENSGHVEEDIVHLRLRGIFLSLEGRF